MTDRDFELSEMDRRLSRIVKLGRVEEADYERARVRVRIGAAVTGWLPWLTARAGGDSSWWAPEVGEQVVVLSPDGELAAGVVLAAIYRAAHPAPAGSPNVHRVEYADGTWVEYDREAHALRAYCVGEVQIEAEGDIAAQAGGAIALAAAGDVTIAAGGNVKITGKRVDLN